MTTKTDSEPLTLVRTTEGQVEDALLMTAVAGQLCAFFEGGHNLSHALPNQCDALLADEVQAIAHELHELCIRAMTLATKCTILARKTFGLPVDGMTNEAPTEEKANCDRN